MKLTSKGRFAVTALVDLTLYQSSKPVKLTEISKRQGISLSFLGQIFNKLKRNGVVLGSRGPNGGYMLSKNSSEITLSEIIAAIDENVKIIKHNGIDFGCSSRKHPHSGKSLTQNLWTELRNHIFFYLDTISLDDIVNNRLNPIGNLTELNKRILKDAGKEKKIN